MKTSNRILAMLLALMLLVSLCACGGSAADSAAAEDSAPADSAAPAEEEVEEEAEAEAPAEEEEALPEASAEEAPAEEAVIDSSHLYPVFDELTTVTAFLNIAPWASAYIGPDAEFENAQAILYAEDKTNVHLDVDWSDPDTYNEKVNLLVAANDLPNITRDLSRLYSTGADGLIEDELCEDLTPYFEEYAPEYYHLLQTNAKFASDTSTATGVAVTMYSYTEIPQYTRGPMARMDMLKAAGVNELPTTVSELYEAAKALKSVVAAPVVSPKMIADAYAGADFISSNDIAMTWWNIDGTMTAAVTLDSNYDWAVEARKWNEEGLFVEDWYNPMPFYDFDVLADKLAIAYAPYSMAANSSKAIAANPDTFEFVPMANVVLNEGDTIKTQSNGYGGRGDGDWCITTADPDMIPQLVSYVNWFFTEEGIMVSNFGIEGETYTIDEDGNVQYTDLILKDPNGYGNMAVYAIFTNNNDNPFYYKMERTELTYDNEVEATVYDTWLSNITSEYVTNYTMTQEETTAYNALATDLATTVQEYMTKFMTGDMDLNEQTWADFQAKLESLGLGEMQEIVQGAYDRCNG